MIRGRKEAEVEVLMLDFEEIKNLARFMHWIPRVRLWHLDFVEKTYPGWDWDELMNPLFDKGVIKLFAEKDKGRTRLCLDVYIKNLVTGVEYSRTTKKLKFRVIMEGQE